MEFNKVLNEVGETQLNEASINVIKKLLSRPESFSRALKATKGGDWSLLTSGINDEEGEPMSPIQAFEEIATYLKNNKNKLGNVSLSSIQTLLNNLNKGGEKAITDEMVKRWSRVIWGNI